MFSFLLNKVVWFTHHIIVYIEHLKIQKRIFAGNVYLVLPFKHLSCIVCTSLLDKYRFQKSAIP